MKLNYQYMNFRIGSKVSQGTNFLRLSALPRTTEIKMYQKSASIITVHSQKKAFNRILTIGL